MSYGPASHLEESLKLTADALVDLFSIQLVTKPVTIRVKNDNTVTWQGNTYEGWPIQLSGDKMTADGEESRPSLIFANPYGAFNRFAQDGDLERATVIRRRVLREALEQDVGIFQQHMWYVSRVREVKSGEAITLELKQLTEGPLFKLPVRKYMPPEFRQVSLR